MAFIDLAALKDDLGITGSADDAWLNRRIAGTLSAMANYTHRYIGPVATFEDDFTRLVDQGRYFVWPSFPSTYRITPYLAQRPITEIVSATNDGASIDVDDILFDPITGELYSLSGAPASNISRDLAGHWVIRYKAGWDVLPADLYEALKEIIGNGYQIRKANAGGGLSIGGLAIQAIQVPDVGSVQLGGASSAFVGAATKGAIDPILGPFVRTLDPYFKPVVGGAVPVSTLISTP